MTDGGLAIGRESRDRRPAEPTATSSADAAYVFAAARDAESKLQPANDRWSDADAAWAAIPSSFEVMMIQT